MSRTSIWWLPIYRYIVYPLLFSVIKVFAFANPKLLSYFRSRRGIYWLKAHLAKDSIWIHCSSGELEYAKPVIRALKNRGERILVTYFSPSVEKNLRTMSEIDLFLPAPLDFFFSIQAFIKHFEPKALYIARTDIWPEMLYQTTKHGIPTYLFSATLSDTNLKLSSFITRSIFSSLYKLFSHIYAVSEEDARNFQQTLGISAVSISGDTRYIQCVERLQNANAPKWPAAKKPFIVFGSTWREDEAHIFTSFKPLHDLGYNIILAPHEVGSKNLNSITQRLPMIYKLFSETKDPFNESLLLVNEVGHLAYLYREASFAFVGGSFKGSVHSVMEPLAAGASVFVGPYHNNNREAMDFKNISYENIPIVNEIQDAEELIQLVKNMQNLDIEKRRSFIFEEFQRRKELAEKGIADLLSRQD